MTCLILHEGLGKWECERNLFQPVSQKISCNVGEVPPGEAWHRDQPPTLFIWSCTSKLFYFL